MARKIYQKNKVYMEVASSLFYLAQINEITSYLILNSMPAKSSMLH